MSAAKMTRAAIATEARLKYGPTATVRKYEPITAQYGYAPAVMYGVFKPGCRQPFESAPDLTALVEKLRGDARQGDVANG